MAYKSFRVQCMARIILLGLTLTLFVILTQRTTLYATLTLVGLWVIYQTVALIQYVEKTNRQFVRFLQSIEYSDLSQSFTGRGFGQSIEELHQAFTRVMDAFRKVRTEREEQYRLLQTVVQHVGVGVIAFQPDGSVEVMNTAARRLFDMPDGAIGKPHNLSALPVGHAPVIHVMMGMKAGDRALVKVDDNQLVLNATAFKTADRSLTLISIQNIRSELEEKEMQAWHDLIRVLTHEIMNSVTPISSLAATANELIESETRQDRLASEPFSDIHLALQTIKARCDGLLGFVQTYRQLTRIPEPQIQSVSVSDLFARIERLFRPRTDTQAVHLSCQVRPVDLEVAADAQLLEQVLINLVTNALHALEGGVEGCVTLTGYADSKANVVLEVTDNGPGILPEVIEKIFIPFFTTKPDGSGIGLSLSRQIMRLHYGSLSVYSAPDDQTIFRLKF